MTFDNIEEMFAWLQENNVSPISSLTNGGFQVAFTIHSDEQILDTLQEENVGFEISMNDGEKKCIMRDFETDTWSVTETV